VTKDPELAEALRAAAPHLNPAMSVSEQIRHLAIVGARSFPEWSPPDEETLRWAAKRMTDPDDSGLDLDLLRERIDARHRF
jgi:hypothetical protein